MCARVCALWSIVYECVSLRTTSEALVSRESCQTEGPAACHSHIVWDQPKPLRHFLPCCYFMFTAPLFSLKRWFGGKWAWKEFRGEREEMKKRGVCGAIFLTIKASWTISIFPISVKIIYTKKNRKKERRVQWPPVDCYVLAKIVKVWPYLTKSHEIN